MKSHFKTTTESQQAHFKNFLPQGDRSTYYLNHFSPMFHFCIQAVVQRCSVKKVFLEISQNFTGKHLCQNIFFNEVAGLRPATLLKKRLWHRRFPVNFVKILRTSFYMEHLWWLLLSVLSENVRKLIRGYRNGTSGCVFTGGISTNYCYGLTLLDKRGSAEISCLPAIDSFNSEKCVKEKLANFFHAYHGA